MLLCHRCLKYSLLFVVSRFDISPTVARMSTSATACMCVCVPVRVRMVRRTRYQYRVAHKMRHFVLHDVHTVITALGRFTHKMLLRFQLEKKKNAFNSIRLSRKELLFCSPVLLAHTHTHIRPYRQPVLPHGYSSLLRNIHLCQHATVLCALDRRAVLSIASRTQTHYYSVVTFLYILIYRSLEIWMTFIWEF